ncbi:hypothetical protein E4U43_004953, partial [Claviceps pusilla]
MTRPPRRLASSPDHKGSNDNGKTPLSRLFSETIPLDIPPSRVLAPGFGEGYCGGFLDELCL